MTTMIVQIELLMKDSVVNQDRNSIVRIRERDIENAGSIKTSSPTMSRYPVSAFDLPVTGRVEVRGRAQTLRGLGLGVGFGV